MSSPETWIEQLRARLKGPLPGRTAQYRMAAARRLEELNALPAIPADARIGCVLALLYQQVDGWHTVLIRRATNPHDRHSGQVSFPGGRWEEGDGNLVDAALRETEEEIGVPTHTVEILGRLTELYIPVSHFLVYPFVGVLREPVPFQPQVEEVAGILTPALQVFCSAEHRKVMDIPIGPNAMLPQTPYFDVDGHIVWGATAMILSEFVEVLPKW